jgi:hypothetical protein
MVGNKITSKEISSVGYSDGGLPADINDFAEYSRSQNSGPFRRYTILIHCEVFQTASQQNAENRLFNLFVRSSGPHRV